MSYRVCVTMAGGSEGAGDGGGQPGRRRRLTIPTPGKRMKTAIDQATLGKQLRDLGVQPGGVLLVLAPGAGATLSARRLILGRPMRPIHFEACLARSTLLASRVR